MGPPDGPYPQAIAAAADHLLDFLRTFEFIQEHIHFGQFGDAQAQLRDAAGDTIPSLPGQLDTLAPPATMQAFHTSFTTATTHIAQAYDHFVNPQGQDVSVAFMQSRRECCLGLNELYDIHDELPALQPYWVLPDALAQWDQLDTPSPDINVPVGLMHQSGASGSYSLYVPESYIPDHTWPLVVSLHGGYGRGDEYIWTWIRPAKSKGYLVLAPNSTDVTWSILQLSRDTDAIAAMIDTVYETYAIDRSRIYLTGLSDGGTFAYLMGLSQPDRFAGVVPIAGDMLHGVADGMLRQKQGQHLPIFIVHGAQDAIFSVKTTQNAYKLLTHLRYNATYTELPDWGHAYPYSINEQLVLPWFESLTPHPPDA